MTQNLEWNYGLDAFASVTEICSVPCDLNASMPIPNRRKNEELEENVKTDCKYYSGEHLLFCAVNTKCDDCIDYCPK